MKLLKQVSDKTELDIVKNDDGWICRYEYLNSVSYIKMVWMFWRRLDSFYPDKKFIE